jgi:hypothetical protein
VHSSLGFDLTVTSLLTPLLTGRSAVLLSSADEVGQLAQALVLPPHAGELALVLDQVLEHRAGV